MGARQHSGRGDLLRALAARYGCDAGAVDAAVEYRLASTLALHRQAGLASHNRNELAREDEPLPRPPDEPGSPTTDAEAGSARPPLATRLLAVLASEPLSTDAAETTQPASSGPLTTADCGPREPGPPPFVPLVARTRLWPALRSSLLQHRLGPVDEGALVRNLARGRSLHRLPRRRRGSWGERFDVVFDCALRLLPYEADYRALYRELLRLHGRAGLRTLSVAGSPDRVATSSGAGPQPAAASAGLPLPAAGCAVLVLGDLGLLAAGGEARDAWMEYLRRVVEAGGRVIAWLPCSPRLVPAELSALADVHCFGARDLRRLARRASGGVRPQPALEALLTRIACCVRVEPSLLRALRRLSPDTADEPGLEGLLWGHEPVVLAGYQCCELAPAQLPVYRARFAALDATTQAAILRLQTEIHAHRGRATEMTERRIWATHAKSAAVDPELAQLVDEAEQWYGRLAAHAADGPGDVAAFARDLFARQGRDANWLAGDSPALARLWALTGSDGIPAGLAARDVADALAEGSTQVDCELIQHGERLKLRRVTSAASEPSRLGWPQLQVRGGFEWTCLGRSMRHWSAPPRADEMLDLPLGGVDGRYRLIVAGRRHELGLLARPSWVLEWGRDARGLYALAPSPLGAPVRLDWEPATDFEGPQSGSLPNRGFRAESVAIDAFMVLGADLAHGLFLDVSIAGVVQRFRWIEPGEFWMGSPADEAERFDDEGPRHRVRLTQGFWLSETACSQALWQAVMGENPSRFTDDRQNPVERVSWDDVQDFLQKLSEGLASVRAELPSEAEWEYACRAGGETAFHWGDAIDPSQANYDGSVAYAGGATGEGRGRTVPVKSFAPNAWGLYQMHGNVWEWCADYRGGYRDEACTDPRGPDGAGRAVRGGGWGSGPGRLRSAFRYGWPRDGRNDLLGFRFALRSTGREAGAERLPTGGDGPEARRPRARAPGGRASATSSGEDRSGRTTKRPRAGRKK